VCGINDPGHTCDEYMVLLAKLSMTLRGGPTGTFAYTDEMDSHKSM
jgi:hypothetical protein